MSINSKKRIISNSIETLSLISIPLMFVVFGLILWGLKKSQIFLDMKIWDIKSIIFVFMLMGMAAILLTDIAWMTKFINDAKGYERNLKNKQETIETFSNLSKKIQDLLKLSNNDLLDLIRQESSLGRIQQRRICLRQAVTIDILVKIPEIFVDWDIIRQQMASRIKELQVMNEAWEKNIIMKPKSYIFFERIFTRKRKLAVC